MHALTVRHRMAPGELFLRWQAYQKQCSRRMALSNHHCIFRNSNAGRTDYQPSRRPGAKLSRLHLTVLSGIICGAAFAIFGALSSVVLVISAMLLIPLMLSIPEYFIGELENKIIDQLELKDNRAASLSMMNIGVNLVQVVSFFAASVLTKIGIGWCFAFCGISIIACSLAMLLNRRKSTADMKEQN